MATNLLEKLTSEDRALIKRYMELYASTEGSVCNLDTYLSFWAESKSKLYHLLGDNLMVKIPYSVKLDNEEMESLWIRKVYDETRRLVYCILELSSENCFDSIYGNAIFDIETYTRELSDEFYKIVEQLYLPLTWVSNEINVKNSCFKVKLKNGKTFRVNDKMKPLKLMSKIVDIIAENRKEETEKIARIEALKDRFEKLRLIHSRWVEEKHFEGTLVLSIHPLDFMTMSDNNSDWSSCMSWVRNGCYRVGTVEMMNSNNVICTYLESKNSSFTFDAENNLKWNNKKFRQLFYVTKDILLGGEPYPYENKEMTLTILNHLRELAKNNLHWKYSFGPQLYKDMSKMNHYGDIDYIRSRYISKRHKKIIFNTNGMYNDFLTKDKNWWCVRNKVENTKIISASGKTMCACCGVPDILTEREDIDWDYYEDEDGEEVCNLYTKTSELLCHKCIDEGSCSYCDKFVGKNKLTTFKKFWRYEYQDVEVHLCPDCAEIQKKRSCSFCKEENLTGNSYTPRQSLIFIKTEFYDKDKHDIIRTHNRIKDDIYLAQEENLSFIEYYKKYQPPYIFLNPCSECFYKLSKNTDLFTFVRDSFQIPIVENFNDILITINQYSGEEIFSTIDSTSNHFYYNNSNIN